MPTTERVQNIPTLSNSGGITGRLYLPNRLISGRYLAPLEELKEIFGVRFMPFAS